MVVEFASNRDIILFKYWKNGVKVVILDAAVLLEAGWDNVCHEIWVCTIPRYATKILAGSTLRIPKLNLSLILTKIISRKFFLKKKLCRNTI